jgi:Holliday junction resolvase RusA-like endonuclease
MKKMQVHLTLPLPTSINQLYQNQVSYNKDLKRYIPTGKRILTDEGTMCKKLIQKQAMRQMKKQEWDYEWTETGYIYLDTIIYFNKKGRDDNNLYKLLCDSLEKICYDNDSRVLIRTQRILYDTKNPRIEVMLSPVEYIGIFDNDQEFDEFIDNCQTCKRYQKGKCSILNKAKEGRIQEEIGNMLCNQYTEKKSK